MQFTSTAEILMLGTWGAVVIITILVIPSIFLLIRMNHQEIKNITRQLEDVEAEETKPQPDILVEGKEVFDPDNLLGRTVRVNEHRWLAQELLSDTSAEDPDECNVVIGKDGTFVPEDHAQRLEMIRQMEARLGLPSGLPAQERSDGPLPIRPPQEDQSVWDAHGEIVLRVFNGQDGCNIDPDEPTDVEEAPKEP